MATRNRRKSERVPEGHVDQDLVLRALAEVGGAALVLDARLRIVAGTVEAAMLLGTSIPIGTSAPKLLCGHAVERPMAEALASGRAVVASIPRPTARGGERAIRARGLPLHEGDRRVGWLLLFDVDATGVAASDAAVEFRGIWTRDPAMKQLFRIVEKVARSEASVLVRGETGAGKELIANAIHAISPRHRGPFRAINCAALPPTLLESELFGHARGAFTGAVRDNPGHFKLADKGTLFLDEVADMPLDLQAKLLRVLETHTVIPVGGREPISVDVRIVTATHRGLRGEVEAGRFRADLMYRLRVVPIHLPPLRRRQGDVQLLTSRFIDEHNARGQRHIERVSAGARGILERYDWPGNVRELRNVIEYAFVIGEGPVLFETDLPPELSDPAAASESNAPQANQPAASPTSIAGSPEAIRIWRALERASGSREQAAKILGMSRVTLWRRMKLLGLGGDQTHDPG